MTTIGDLMARLTRKVKGTPHDVLTNEDRRGAVLAALREHNASSPRHVIVDVSAGFPVSEYALPAAFGAESQVVEIEHPVDQVPKSSLEPELRWRLARTSTDAKIVFASAMESAFRLVHTQPWQETEADLGFMADAEAEAVATLGAHHAALGISAYYANVVQGAAGMPADVADPGRSADVWRALAEDYRAEYVRMLRGDEDDPRGPVVMTSEAAMRRLGYPHRSVMPRDAIFQRRGP